MNNLILHLIGVEKEQTNPKASRRKKNQDWNRDKGSKQQKNRENQQNQKFALWKKKEIDI